MASTKVLRYIITGEDRLSPAMAKASANMKRVTSSWAKTFDMVGKAAALGMAAGFSYSVHKAMAVPLAQLKNTIKNAGGSYDAWKPKIAAVEDQMAKLGFGMGDVDQSLINLTRSTGSVGRAMSLQATAANLAKAKNISLADASMMLARAGDGNFRALKGLNIAMATGSTRAKAMGAAQKTLKDQLASSGGVANFARQHHMTLARAQGLVSKASHGNISAFNALGITVLPKTATSAERLSQVQKVLNARIGGSASAAANTFRGKVAALKAEFGNMAARIGLAVLPMLSSLMGAVSKVASNKTAVKALAVAVTAMAAAWVGAKIAVGLFQTGARAALIGSGIGIAILAISTLILLMITHWKTVKKVALQVWNAIVGFLKGVWAWMRGAWNAVCGALVAAWRSVAGFFRAIWNGVVGFFRGAWDFFLGLWRREVQGFKNIFAGIKGFFSGIWNAVKNTAINTWDAIKRGISKVWSGIKTVVKTPIKWVVDFVWNPFAGVVNKFTSFLGLGKPIPVVHLARGGKLPGYGGGDRIPALLEAGETVVDKKRTRRLAPIFAAAGVPGFQGGGLLGDIWGGITGAAKSAWSGVKTAANWAKNLVAGMLKMAAKPLINGLVAALSHMPGGSTGFGRALTQLPKTLFNKFLGWLGAKDAKASAGGYPGGGKVGAGAAAAMRFAQSILHLYGWGAGEFPSLRALWMGESGWRWNALNQASGAYGIPQSLPASKMAAAGADWRTNAATQIRWGLGYIRATYGSPHMAYAMWLARNPHWYGKGGLVSYDRGGWLRPGYTLAYNGTGRAEPVGAAALPPITLNARIVFPGGKSEMARVVVDSVEYGRGHGVKVPWPRGR